MLARLPLILKWLDQARPDVLCVQEIKCVEERFPADAFAEIGYTSAAYGQPTYNGVAVISRSEIKEVRRGFPDEEAAQARLLATTVAGIQVVNVYVPNGQSVGSDKYEFKLGWLARLREFFDSEYDARKPVLLCGDFNVAPEDRDVHNPKLWAGRILFSKPERAAIERVKEWGLVNAFRLHNAEEKQFSWWDYRMGSFRRNLGLRIDHIWVTESLAARCESAWIDKEPRGWDRPSDHTPVVAEFKTKG